MTNHTAADFANAKFAEHERGEFAARICADDCDTPWASSSDEYFTDAEMVLDGWVPVSTKPTITESQYKLALDEDRDPQYVHGFTYAMHLLGGEVIPDPEPTNAEKIIDLMGKAPANLNRRDLAAWLDKAGVTAPKEDGK